MTKGYILKGTRFFRLGSSFADLHMKLIELSSHFLYGDAIGALTRRLRDHSDSHAHTTLTPRVPSARSSHACFCFKRIPRGLQREKSCERPKRPFSAESEQEGNSATCEGMSVGHMCMRGFRHPHLFCQSRSARSNGAQNVVSKRARQRLYTSFCTKRRSQVKGGLS